MVMIREPIRALGIDHMVSGQVTRHVNVTHHVYSQPMKRLLTCFTPSDGNLASGLTFDSETSAARGLATFVDSDTFVASLILVTNLVDQQSVVVLLNDKLPARALSQATTILQTQHNTYV